MYLYEVTFLFLCVKMYKNVQIQFFLYAIRHEKMTHSHRVIQGTISLHEHISIIYPSISIICLTYIYHISIIYLSISIIYLSYIYHISIHPFKSIFSSIQLSIFIHLYIYIYLFIHPTIYISIYLNIFLDISI